MIGNALRIDIEHYAARRRQNPIFLMAENGTLTLAMATRYIACVHYMISQTPAHLGRAHARALSLGDEKLAAHYAHKLDEEVGHDAWSKRDLESLTQMVTTSKPSTSNTSVVPATRRLADYLVRTIDEDPSLYLTYIAFAEYITVVVGPQWLMLLEERCGIPRTSLSVIAKHVELDQEHAEEGFAVMDDLVGDPRKLARMRQALAEATAHFDAYCVEVTTTTGPTSMSGDEEAVRYHESEPRVSAA